MFIKKPDPVGYQYERATFESGKTLDIVSGHRVFSLDKGKFKYAKLCVGDRILRDDGTVDIIVSYDTVMVDESNKPRFYNVITEHNFNLYANGYLTSCRLSNMYPFDIENMKYLKYDKSPVLFYEDFKDIMPYEMWVAMRMDEQDGVLKDMQQYCKRLVNWTLPKTSNASN